MGCNCMPKKKKVVEVFSENIQQNITDRFTICLECEHYGKTFKVCEKLDCKECKGSVIVYLSTVKNHCPIEKW